MKISLSLIRKIQFTGKDPEACAGCRMVSFVFASFCSCFFFSWAFSKTFKRRDRFRSLITTENAFFGRDSVVDLNAAKRANVLLNYF